MEPRVKSPIPRSLTLADANGATMPTAGKQAGTIQTMKLDDFLLEDYKLKIAYLTNHFDRMWSRFNFFVGIETATMAAFAAILGLPDGASHVIFVAVFGLFMGLVWWIAGSQDRYLVGHYRSHVAKATESLRDVEKDDRICPTADGLARRCY
jgi:hypothetical protein